MKMKEICLCLFAVSDALLGFLIRMPKPSRVGTDCFSCLSLFLCAKWMMMTWNQRWKREQGKVRTGHAFPWLTGFRTHTHTPVAMTGSGFFSWEMPVCRFWQSVLQNGKWKASFVIQIKKGAQTSWNQFLWKRIVDNQVCSAAKSWKCEVVCSCIGWTPDFPRLVNINKFDLPFVWVNVKT